MVKFGLRLSFFPPGLKLLTDAYPNTVWNRSRDSKARIFLSSHNAALSLSSSGCFIYILESPHSSLIIFWTSQFGSSSRCNWTGIWTGNSNGSWTYKQSSHISYILFHVKTTTNKIWNDTETLLKSFWTSHLQMMNEIEPLF